MTAINTNIKTFFLSLVVVFLFSCQQPGKNVTGSEFMPDMGHSVAYEANYYNYYYNNTWGTQKAYYEYAKPRLPVNGTISRGYAGSANLDRINGRTSINAVAHAPSGSVPYYYPNTEEGRLQAMEEIIQNPYPITDEGLARGKKLYDIYCGICHGEQGDGLGYLVREDGGKYLAQPANLLLEEFVTASNGRYYHTLMYGRNLMGAYKDKLSYEERWQVTHYVRALQAKALKLEYNQLSNTLNTVEIPAGEIVHVEESAATDHDGDDQGAAVEGEHKSDDHDGGGRH